MTTPDLFEGLFETPTQRFHIQCLEAALVLRGDDFKVLDEDRFIADVNFVGVLGDHPHAHVFHHRQGIGQHEGRGIAEGLEAQSAVLGAGGAVQIEAQIIWTTQRSQLSDIECRHFRRGLFDVTHRQSLTVARGPLQTALLAKAGHQTISQLVVPVAHDLGEARFDGIDIHRDRLTTARADDHVQLRQRRLTHLHIGVQTLTMQRVTQQRLRAQTNLGVVAVARDVDQRRVEASVAITTQEYTGARPFLQRQDAHRGIEQLGLIGLEQLIARQTLQQVAQ